MQDTAVAPLAAWENFYVIVGSASAALTGLMFVVITLIAGTQVQRSSRTVATFGTPTVVHFCAALLISAIICAPWQTLWTASIPIGLCGLGGVAYAIVVLQRARHQSDYQPVLEDWLWHTIFPFISYIVLVVAAILLPIIPVVALFSIGGATVLFLFIGIHNAWDTVTYVAIEQYPNENQSQNP